MFVDDLEEPALTEVDEAHFRRVLRMKADDLLNVSDGKGSWRPAKLAADGLALEPVGEVCRVDPPAASITVAFAPTKGDRPEWTVQKLTELGVSRIVPVRTERSVVTWPPKRADRQRERWRKIGREAAMQSRRTRLPEIDAMVDLVNLVEMASPVFLCAPGGDRLEPQDATFVVGPEGGFAPSELSRVKTVDLGVDTILRTETAAVVAATLALSR